MSQQLGLEADLVKTRVIPLRGRESNERRQLFPVFEIFDGPELQNSSKVLMEGFEFFRVFSL